MFGLFENKENKQLPWIVEGLKVFGWHEKTDNGKLKAWLKSGGKALGDPSALPWCGDFVETCITKALPNEPFVGAVGQNPFFARNWLGFGKKVLPQYGAVVVFERGPTSGHVGFLVGEDSTDFYVLGGNQGDRVCVSRISKSRALGFRFPTTYPETNIPLKRMTPDNIPKTVNEV